MKKKTISIAMTSYNGEKYVIEQLQSILIQTLEVNEVVIVDDKSTDETVKLIQNFIKKNDLSGKWKLHLSEANEGFIKTFNKAISLTTGDIIFLADQDDIWENNKVEKMSKILEDEKKKALSSTFLKINSHGELIGKNKNTMFGSNYGLINSKLKDEEVVQIFLREVIEFNISPGCTSVFKKEIKDLLLQDGIKNIMIPHDWKVNIIAAYLEGLYFYNSPTIKYRLHSNNTIGLNRSFNSDIRSKKCLEFSIEKEKIQKLIAEINKIHPQKVKSANELIVFIKALETLHYNRSEILRKNSLLDLFKLAFFNRKNLKRNIKFFSVDAITILNSFKKRV